MIFWFEILNYSVKHRSCQGIVHVTPSNVDPTTANSDTVELTHRTCSAIPHNVIENWSVEHSQRHSIVVSCPFAEPLPAAWVGVLGRCGSQNVWLHRFIAFPLCAREHDDSPTMWDSRWRVSYSTKREVPNHLSQNKIRWRYFRIIGRFQITWCSVNMFPNAFIETTRYPSATLAIFLCCIILLFVA